MLMNLEELNLTPKRRQICERLGLNDSLDILSYYPVRYEQMDAVSYRDFTVNGQVCFVGELSSYPSTFRRGKLSTARFKVLYEDQIISVTIFNRPWIRNVDMNERITIIGRYDGNNKVTASNYYAKDVTGQIIPYYPLKEGISQNEIKKLIQHVFSKCEDEIEDIVPSDLIKKHDLIDYRSALKFIHGPHDRNQLAKAISRLKYEEFLRFYLALGILRDDTASSDKKAKVFSLEEVGRLIDSFGFELTEDQKSARDDVLKDLASPKTMYRLIQGEVGSGKTAVAVIGLYANYLAGYQGALMAPTEILAKQHYESLRKTLEPFGVRVGVIYSAMDSERRMKEKLRDGEIDVIVGTHALFSRDVEYRNLGLVIADEQHRFGVKQRQALKEKGDSCDFILMSATPIPRTLASSLYGDMDISTIASMPQGRKGCRTYLVERNSIVTILDDIKKKLEEGRQVYLIAAAIEKSDSYNAKDAQGLYESLIDVFSPYKVGILHGKMDSWKKDQIMNDFKENRIQVLVSTTVVEVGVNVRNATVMVIYDADRFGLSQIHQLRGRVQRSDYEGTCYLLTDSRDENVLKRLQILVDSNDGFEISYEDLKIRGPGDILGTRQSGIPAFILGNLVEDTKFIDAARKDAHRISENQDDPEYRNYYEKISQLAAKNYIS
ncbi:MAG: ATP-dependent DNA helicase RecG [Erysipelotrichaceae bacterium]|nr:ATP-dependent DNA helicase RecG [Erysipelotrichaceae bacterium]